MPTRERIEITGLPLAVYRELAAHLRQVDHVSVEVIPQSSPQFDYSQSQVEGLWLSFADNISVQGRHQVEEILKYYRERYGS